MTSRASWASDPQPRYPLAQVDFLRLLDPHAWLGLAVLFSAGFAVYITAITIFTFRRLRHPPRRTYGYAVSRSLPGDPSEITTNPPAFETWAVNTQDTQIEIWDIKGDNKTGPTIIATHGWGSCRIDMLSRFAALRTHAARVLLYDMRGHGDTKGNCTLGVKEPADLNAIIKTVRHDANTDASNETIILYGYSLGAEVTIAAVASANQQDNPAPINGIILEAPYRRGITPAKAVLQASEFPWRINLLLASIAGSLLDRRPPNERWRDLTEPATLVNPDETPLLVIHGVEDSISPIEDGRRFAQCAQGTIKEVPQAGHKDLYQLDQPVRPEIANALETYFNNLRS